MKTRQAKELIAASIGVGGLWASPQRYRHQCWTRDFVLAGMDGLAAIGRTDVIERHLHNLAKRQRPDGRIPIMFVDDAPRFLWAKVRDSWRQRRVSFVLKSYFSADGIEFLSPNTTDSELLFALAAARHARLTEDDSLLNRLRPRTEAALNYVECSLLTGGLVRGGDWRDTRYDLEPTCVLTNNCLLYSAYDLLGKRDQAEALRQIANDRFWNGRHYRDYVGPKAATDPEGFDPLGNALAILTGLAPRDRWDLILDSAAAVASPYGYRVFGVTVPPKTAEEAAINARAGREGTIWPWVHDYLGLALLAAGRRDAAAAALTTAERLPGFYEWHDPRTGDGHGGADQVWSAAAYLRLRASLKSGVRGTV